MKTTSKDLLGELRALTVQNLEQAKRLSQMTFEELNSRPSPRSWSALECLEHLNFYGKFYLPEIEKKIAEKKYPSEEIFKSGWLGNYFAQSMLPGEKMKKIKTLKSQDPLGKVLGKEVIKEFMDQQEKMLELLSRASEVSLTRTRTAISIAKFVKLRLGDILRLNIYHNQRHLLQAERAVKADKEIAA